MSETIIPTRSHEVSKNTEQLNELVNENKESMRDKLERAEKEHREKSDDSHETLQKAKDLAERHQEHGDSRIASPAERRRGPISKKQLNSSFDNQMNYTRAQMRPASRVFSKFIHAKPIEKASDVIGGTVARPNALLSGSVSAFLVITLLYLAAKHYGFQLSGFETIGAFIIGWLVGILYDYFTVMIRGRKD